MESEDINHVFNIKSRGTHSVVEFNNGSNESIDLIVPVTVYPPREDTDLLLAALEKLEGGVGNAVEIGVGSGAISIALAQRGWKVRGFDVNPFAVAAARGNVESIGLTNSTHIEEGGPGETGWKLPSNCDLIVWNLPYLNPPGKNQPSLPPIEEAGLTDLDSKGGWSEYLRVLLSGNIQMKDDLLVVILFRTEPISPSSPNDWISSGWGANRLARKRLADETLEVWAFWKPGGGVEPIVIDSTNSTMEEAKKLHRTNWQRVLTLTQKKGRGRRGSVWESEEGDLIGTWSTNKEILQSISPGLLQTIIGGLISNRLDIQCKWPNDLMFDGRKIGGILLESSSDDERIRVGVGINKKSRLLNGISVSGWEEMNCELSYEDVFKRIDGALASAFSAHYRVSFLDKEEMLEISWKSISTSLSRGVFAELNGERVRIIGIEEKGTLEISNEINIASTDELGGLIFSF